MDVLQGLKYVMDYRIKGGKYKNLEQDLMRRLLESLLQNMSGKKGNLLFESPTAEADLAFVLFGDFLEEVDTFRYCVGAKSVTDLSYALKIHRRCQPRSTIQQKTSAASVLALLTKNFPQFSEWKDLVKEKEHDDAAKLFKEFPKIFDKPAMPPLKDGLLFPPQGNWDIWC